MIAMANTLPARRLVAFEELHRPLVFFGGGAAAECAEISAAACLGVFLARVESVLARLELANHGCLPCIACKKGARVAAGCALSTRTAVRHRPRQTSCSP